MTVYEMEGFLRGKCLPGDMKVNESNAQYLVRKFSEFESNLSESKREFRAADATIHNLELKLTDMAVQLANAESKCRDKFTAELDNALCELLPGTQYMDPPDGGSVTPLEQVRRMIADYRNRIEELESRSVTLPKSLNSYAGVKIYRQNDVIEAIRAAGIGVKGE